MNNTPTAIIDVLLEVNSYALVKVVEDLFTWKHAAYDELPSGVLSVNFNEMNQMITLFQELIEQCIHKDLQLQCWTETEQDLLIHNNKIEIKYNYHGNDTTFTTHMDMPSHIHPSGSMSLFNDYKIWLLHLFSKLSTTVFAPGVNITSIYDSTDNILVQNSHFGEDDELNISPIYIN